MQPDQMHPTRHRLLVLPPVNISLSSRREVPLPVNLN
jgi:hypothetical protein